MERWRAAIHQAATTIALSVLVDVEWVTGTRVDAGGGRTWSAAQDGRERLSREVFVAEVTARHAGSAAESLFLGSAWSADGEDVALIRQLYQASRRRADLDLDIPVVQVLLDRIPRDPREVAARPIPSYRDDAATLVTEYRAAIERLARVLVVRDSLIGMWLEHTIKKVLERTAPEP